MLKKVVTKKHHLIASEGNPVNASKQHNMDR